MKLKTVLFLFAAISLTVFSCSKDDDNPGSNSGNILGTWDIQTAHLAMSSDGETVNDTTYRFTEDGDYARVTFNADQTFLSETKTDGETETGTGTYVYKNGKLTLTPDDDEETDPTLPVDLNTINCKIAGKKMTLSASYSAPLNDQTVKMEVTIQAVKE